MPQLKCYEDKCAHNHCTHCVREIIKVGFDAYCKSYRKKTPENEDVAAFEYEYAMDMGLPSHMDGHPIECENTICKFQGSGICHHQYVKVDQKVQGPLCVSFEKR